MNVAVMASTGSDLVGAFIARSRERLRGRGIEIAVVVLDDNAAKRARPLRHALAIAKRQGRAANCSVPEAVCKIVAYKVATAGGDGTADPAPPATALPPTVTVATLNGEDAIAAVRTAGCDLVCLMGARILTKRTLAALAVPIINVHASDPRAIRGGPAVVWEILARETAIRPTIHRVTEVLDGGGIHAQGEQPILFRGGLGATTRATMRAARDLVADLFERVITDYADGTVREQGFAPGPLRVTPSVTQTARAEWICRRRSAFGGSDAKATTT